MTKEEIEKFVGKDGLFRPLMGENYFVPRIFNGKATYQEAINKNGRDCYEYRTKEAAIAKAQKQIDERDKKDVITKTKNIDTPPEKWEQKFICADVKALPKTWKGLWIYFLWVIGRNKVPFLTTRGITTSVWIRTLGNTEAKLETNQQPNETNN